MLCLSSRKSEIPEHVPAGANHSGLSGLVIVPSASA
jgi:hypothetical protein